MRRVTSLCLLVVTLVAGSRTPVAGAIADPTAPRPASSMLAASPPHNNTPHEFQPAVAQVFANATAVALGYWHTCVITPTGGVKCWGDNDDGELGDGTTMGRWVPVDVVGLGTGVQAIAAGGFWNGHTCALTTTGGVKCWGNNMYGQLGDGTTTNRLTPVDVMGLTSGVKAISTGDLHTCALTTTGGVKCWGNNWEGQLGDGTTTSRWTPTDVVDLDAGAQAIAASDHTCALTTVGGVKCWGGNDYGQLGDGTTTDSLTPVDVAGLTGGAQGLDTGASHSCALIIGGGIKCWGYNGSGALGDDTAIDRWTPVDVVGLAVGVKSITAGFENTCAVLLAGGGVKCWGLNSEGQLGDGTLLYHLAPVDVVDLTGGATAVATGGGHTCAVTIGGGVKCWGFNRWGQLGDGTAGNNRLAPAFAIGLTREVQALDTGESFSCAVTGGGVKCWGANLYGQLGDGGTLSPRYTPADVVGLTSAVTAVATGWEHACVLTTAGGVKCWGKNHVGEVGDGTTTTRWTPVDVVGLATGVQAIAAGGLQTCALTTTGGVKCWGFTIGNEPDRANLTPVDVAGLTSGVSAIAVGAQHACALTTAGGVKCWGGNRDGQLGDGTTTRRETPVDVVSLTSGVTSVAVGRSHTCALTTIGDVRCWGENGSGQLGDGTTSEQHAPVNVTNLASGVQQIALGGEYTCAVTAARGTVCWGANRYGQLGDGTSTNRLTPVAVKGVDGSVQSIAPGIWHTCALTVAGRAKCWGNNWRGQLGVNPGWAPVDVSFPAPLPSDPGLFVPYIEQ